MSSQLLIELLLNCSLSDSTKTKLFDLFAENNMSEDIVEYIVTQRIRITRSCLEVAWKYSNVNQKEGLFRDNLELLNSNDLEKYFADLGEKYKGFADRVSRHQVELEESRENIRFAEYLKKVKYITSYEIVERDRFDVVSGTHKKRKVIKCRIKQKK